MGLFDWFRGGKKEPPGRWRVGDRILGEWGEQKVLFPGTVRDFNSQGLYHIRFDDGDAAWLNADQLMKLDLGPGSRVLGRWRGGPQFYPGIIDHIKGDTIHVTYDDGDQEWTTLKMIAVLPRSVTEPAEVSNPLIDEAIKAIENGDHARTVELTTALLRQDPSNGVCYVKRAGAYADLGQNEDAIADCARALSLELDKNMVAEAHYVRGRARSDLNRFAEAEADVIRAISLVPDRPDFHRVQGEILKELGRRSAAIAAYNRALSLAPGDIATLLERGACYREREHYASAVEDLSAVLEHKPDSHVVLSLRGMSYLKLNNPAQGVTDLNQAIDLWRENVSEPTPVGLYYARATMLTQLGRFAEALADFDYILAQRPDQTFIEPERAAILRALGRHQEADAALDKLHDWALQEIQDLERNGGVPVMAALVMANGVLYDPSSEEHSYCRVLLTFDPVLGKDFERLCELALWLGSWKNTEQSEPQMQYLAELTTIEQANTELRRRLPADVTGGPVVYVTDLWVYRRFWPVLNETLLPCVAQPGDVGRQLLLPKDQGRRNSFSDR